MEVLQEPKELYNSNESFPQKEETYKIIGTYLEVHKELDNGFWKQFIKTHLPWNLTCKTFLTKERSLIL